MGRSSSRERNFGARAGEGALRVPRPRKWPTRGPKRPPGATTMAGRRLLRCKKLIAASLSLFFFFLILIRTHISPQNHVKTNDEAARAPRLAILVPFRDRFDELMVFVPYLSKFLKQQNINQFKIYILNQSARYRFNRGALANAGFMLARNESDYIAIHDVDLIPLNQNLSYAYPNQGPYHLSSPRYHPDYNYDKYFGGILLINNRHFQLVNGFSNRYFGWGLEDDEFYTRVRAAKLPISRPPDNLTTDKNSTFLHFHYTRPRDVSKTKEQREALRFRDRSTGLSNLRFSVTSTHNLTIDQNHSCQVYNIELDCDTTQTPWCLHNQSNSIKYKQQRPTALASRS